MHKFCGILYFLFPLSCFSFPTEDSLPRDDVGPPFQNLPVNPGDLEQEKQTVPATLKGLTIDLKNPTFSQGVLHTDDGGVITAEGLRIQAEKIDYIDRIEEGARVKKVIAEGDLLVEFADRVFVGSKLEFDCIARTGTLWNGKTFTGAWFLGGDRIDLKADESFYIYNAFITTSESQTRDWDILAKKVSITEEYLLSANNVTVRLFKIPFFWVPAIKGSLKAASDPPIRYKLVWDKGLNPRLTMRYRMLSWRDLNLFLRADYRLKKGWGGAFESEYSPNEKTTFVTRNYAANEKTFPFQSGDGHYRFQGLYHTSFREEKTKIHLTYDKLSDYRMVDDFPSSDFEINTQMVTELSLDHEEDNCFAKLRVRPRINSFQSVNQELPSLAIGFRPLNLRGTGILSMNRVRAGYLNYVYDNELTHDLHKMHIPRSIRAGRIETNNSLAWPLHYGPLRFTPKAGIVAIFYSSNPRHQAVGQGILSYGADLGATAQGKWNRYTHQCTPYLSLKGLSRPTVSANNQFFFDINDGYSQLNQLRIGLHNSLLSPRHFLPKLTIDLYTYAFFSNSTFGSILPKYYLDCSWKNPSLALRSNFAWNAQEDLWDFTNLRADWTLNTDFACGVEFRHRSRFDWRKADHTNFILDMTRPIEELLESPLSDGRNTLLSRFQIRLGPKWTCHIETRNGWGRRNEPSYYASKIDLNTLITWNWNLRLSYERLPGDNRFSAGFNLIK